MPAAGGAEEPPSGPAEQWLACGHCALPLVAAAELIEEKFVSWQKVTWAYELGVLGREGTWCYSATNVHDHRFDVVRALPDALGRSIRCSGEPTPEHSWFPGFSWSMAHCGLCDAHLGWGFSPDGAGPEPGQGALPCTAPGASAAAPSPRGPPEGGEQEKGREGQTKQRDAARARSKPAVCFFGLVLTKMREKELQRGEVERRLAEAEQSRLAGAALASVRLLQELVGDDAALQELVSDDAARLHGRLRRALHSVAASGRVSAAGLLGRPEWAGANSQELRAGLVAARAGQGTAPAAEGPGDEAPAPAAEASGAAA